LPLCQSPARQARWARQSEKFFDFYVNASHLYFFVVLLEENPKCIDPAVTATALPPSF
jgi:hypothetical protein